MIKFAFCDFCGHLYDPKGCKCEAFPSGIPRWFEGSSNNCNNGIAFSKRDGILTDLPEVLIKEEQQKLMQNRFPEKDDND